MMKIPEMNLNILELRMGVLPLALVMNLILLSVNLILQIFSRKDQAKSKRLCGERGTLVLKPQMATKS